jgi:multidrug efflux system membrane fusion protein
MKRSSRNDSFALPALAFLLLSMGALAQSACSRAGAQPSQAPPPPKVTVAEVAAREVTEWDEFTGRLEAVQSVAIRPRVSGYVAAIRFDEGAMVKKGDLLFEIDARPFQAEVDRLHAEVTRAQATVRRATSDLERARRLSADNAMSPEEIDRRAASPRNRRRRYRPSRPPCAPPSSISSSPASPLRSMGASAAPS